MKLKMKHWFEWICILCVIGLVIYETYNPLGDKIEYWIGPAGRWLSCFGILVIFFRCLYTIANDSEESNDDYIEEYESEEE